MVEWCVLIKDREGSDRTPFLTEHFARIGPIAESGKLVCGGAVYKDDGTPAGSHLQVEAASKDEVLKLIHEDVFTRESIWDLSTLIIYRFECAVRQAKK